jgi:hypothetical protein
MHTASKMTPDRYRALASVRDFSTAVEKIVASESARTGNRWLLLYRLNIRLAERYGLSASAMAQQLSQTSSFYDLLATSGQFSLYRTPNPEEFHIAPVLTMRKGKPLLKQGNQSRERHQPDRKEPKPALKTIPAIHSVDDFEAVLVEIIRGLTTNPDSEKVPLATVCHGFLRLYNQPVRTIRRKVAPDMTLVELLQTIPGLQVQKDEGNWQIAIIRDDRLPGF